MSRFQKAKHYPPTSWPPHLRAPRYPSCSFPHPVVSWLLECCLLRDSFPGHWIHNCAPHLPQDTHCSTSCVPFPLSFSFMAFTSFSHSRYFTSLSALLTVSTTRMHVSSGQIFLHFVHCGSWAPRTVPGTHHTKQNKMLSEWINVLKWYLWAFSDCICHSKQFIVFYLIYFIVYN